MLKGCKPQRVCLNIHYETGCEKRYYYYNYCYYPYYYYYYYYYYCTARVDLYMPLVHKRKHGQTRSLSEADAANVPLECSSRTIQHATAIEKNMVEKRWHTTK